MKLFRTFIIISLLAASFAFLPSLPSASAACINVSGNGDIDVGFGPFSMNAGSTITVTMTTAAVQGTSINMFIDGSYAGGSVASTAEHTYTFSVGSQTDNIELYLNWQSNGLEANTYTIISSECGSALPDIPEQAVSGAFVTAAEIYYEPGKLIMPQTLIDAGKTFLVAGQDATGMYRKVLIACNWVWVRAETVGPNFDAVWNGTPLPTTVVDIDPTSACTASSTLNSVPKVIRAN